MAKARVSTNPMYTGGAGGYSFYVRGGEQVVRQRRNNSNYGESASRSEAQQLRRVKWANLVNFYKSISSWQPKAYETKSPGQTDYNLFMSLNIGYSQIALTKDMALNGCACVAGYTVSRGSLPTIEHDLAPDEGSKGYQINLTQAITGSTTVGQFTQDVLANNQQFREGDNLAFIIFSNIQQSNDYPYTFNVYKEVTLKSDSTQLLSAVVGEGRFAKSTGNLLKLNVGAANSNEAGVVLIHTRKVSGVLQVSTQSILVTSEAFWQEYTGTAWYDECIATYGVDTSVPLDPGVGGDGRYEVVSTQTGNGADGGAVVLDVVNIGAGDFRMAVTPSSWSVDEISDTNDLVFELALSPTAEFSALTERIIKRITKAEMLLGSGANPLDFSTTADMPYARFVLRADSGQSITCLIAKKVI